MRQLFRTNVKQKTDSRKSTFRGENLWLPRRRNRCVKMLIYHILIENSILVATLAAMLAAILNLMHNKVVICD